MVTRTDHQYCVVSLSFKTPHVSFSSGGFECVWPPCPGAGCAEVEARDAVALHEPGPPVRDGVENGSLEDETLSLNGNFFGRPRRHGKPRRHRLFLLFIRFRKCVFFVLFFFHQCDLYFSSSHSVTQGFLRLSLRVYSQTYTSISYFIQTTVLPPPNTHACIV